VKVKVSAAATMLEPDWPSSIMQIEHKEIEDRVASLPGRSIQRPGQYPKPGWLYEDNAVLHPRGS